MEQDQQVCYSEALARLGQFPHLAAVINAKWLEHQMKKSVKQYSLITGWLTTLPDDWNWVFHKNTQALENALALLKAKVSADIWRKLSKKLRAPSDRAESKGTIAEFSLAVFLVQNGIGFDMEQRLDPASSKDVDFRLNFPGAMPVHIEMQSLTESVHSQKLSKLSADWDSHPVGLAFEAESRRVIGRLSDKTPKLIAQSITLVALDCTDIPEHGGTHLGTIRDALTPVFDLNGSTLSEAEEGICQLIDTVIWFQIDYGNALRPVERGFFLNEHSPFRNDPSLLSWMRVWSA
jgi:hypothetical protein